jgi:outer membrane protein assembly factor BamB
MRTNKEKQLLKSHKQEVYMRGIRAFIVATIGCLIVTGLCTAVLINNCRATDWPSWRHDLQNTGAVSDSGYPETLKLLWDQTRSPEPGLGTPARCVTPIAVGGNIVIATGNGGVIEARDQKTGNLLWSKTYMWVKAPEPADAPANWCQGDEPSIETNFGICHYQVDGKCPDWCYQCDPTPLNCADYSLVSPLDLSGFGTFVTAATIDLESSRVYFGTMDGRFFALDLTTGNQVWQKNMWNEPGGPNEGRPWYDQKFAWQLSPPSVYDGKLYFGSFLPSFYWIFKAMPFVMDTSGNIMAGWPSFEKNYKMYWVGRDGWTYCADKNTGNILWGWDPGGCGVTNIPPVAGGKVFFNADTVIDYHYGQMAACDITTNPGKLAWQVGPIPLAQGGNPAISLSRNTIFWPEGDGAVWATDLTTGQVKWQYHGGFCVKGATGVASSMAVDESRGWVLGASDTGHLFVLNMDTGALIRETYLGVVPAWQPGDGVPSSGFWFPGYSAIALVPSQGILYIGGTDYAQAWKGSSVKGREKLFCYNYASSGSTLTLLWEYQFTDPLSSTPQRIVKGHDPYQVSGYSLSSPALADGHVYYGSWNGHVYCFGDPY